MSSLGATSDLLGLLAEPSRVRLLALLGDNELTVNELCSVTELGQSRVSTHLGKLRDAGIVRDRRAGGSTYYRMANGDLPAPARKLWDVVAADLDDRQLATDKQRCAAVLRARALQARGDGEGRWPDTVAGEMERHYSPGRTWEALARGLIGLCDLGDVLDAGAGDGATAQLLAPRARSITCVDVSETLIDAARVRLAGHANVRAEVADLHALPFPDASFDQVLLLNVLTHLRAPARALVEVARVLRPGGRIALVTLDAHDHLDMTSAYGHVTAGFRPAEVRRLIEKAGLDVEQCSVTSREKRAPQFEVVTAFARKSVTKGKRK
ncbi:MAG TPA: metalloregulator ArsR/SmtB family transcription factor [Polyangia bacterium]|jgi:ArsR family transcriptional regulator|nr:metalloregulator ArsR/SmtB family transcription factor [Polyangia bacterium]